MIVKEIIHVKKVNILCDTCYASDIATAIYVVIVPLVMQAYVTTA